MVEFFLPMQEYLPGHHVPDMYVHACEDIKEPCEDGERATISDDNILNLEFVLDPGFIDEKTNIVFLGSFSATTNETGCLEICSPLMDRHCYDPMVKKIDFAPWDS